MCIYNRIPYASGTQCSLFRNLQIISGALCFAELGTIVPKSGAQYAYLHAAFGGPIAYLYAWSAITVTKPSSLAIIILACADYAVQPFYEGTECEPPRMVIKLIAACGISKLGIYVICLFWQNHTCRKQNQ